MSKHLIRFRKFGIGILVGILPMAFWGCVDYPGAATTKPSASASVAPAAQPTPNPPAPYDAAAVTRIRDEAMNRSQVMATLSYLTDVIGPRLTGSPNLKRANEWTRDKLGEWGLENAHLEAWGPFGRGWELKRFSAEVIEPQSIPLIAYPRAWSPGLEQPIEAEVVLLDVRNAAELDAFEGKLEGKIVMIGAERALRAQFTANGTRLTDEALQQLAQGRGARAGGPARGPATTPANELLQADGRRGGRGARGAPTTNPAGAANIATQIFNFAVREKAALICTPSNNGDGGTLFVQGATPVTAGGRGGGRGPSVWAAEPPQVPPQMTISTEQYNRLTRMLKAGEKVRMAVNLQVKFFADDQMAYNTIAEIPGTDLKQQIVMLGGHMDSWHTGTGATDNGAGVAVAMEAVRIIKTLGLKPRRTIRIALWTGEEQGLFGSAAYVRKHFGEVQGGRGGRRGGGPATQASEEAAAAPRAATQTGGRVTKGPDFENLSVYFNLDNGTGKIRGVYTQGNSAVQPIFRAWLAPFADLGATTVTMNNTGSTDHVSYDNIGLPGFQFIQDQIEYNSRTHHSNMDVFDRIQADDMKQASAIMAAFVYNAATMDQRMPRKMTN